MNGICIQFHVSGFMRMCMHRVMVLVRVMVVVAVIMVMVFVVMIECFACGHGMSDDVGIFANSCAKVTFRIAFHVF